jgi:biopolymer transport protein ExbD
MSARARRKRRQKPLESTDIELMPMLNVFMAIIPLLLLGAAFVPVNVIPATLPAAASGAAPAASTEEPLDLVIRIRPEAYLVLVNGVSAREVARPLTADGPATEAAEGVARAELLVVLKEVAAAHTGEREVRIVSRGSTRYREIVDVMDASRAAGLPEAALSDDGEEDAR